MIWLNWRQQRLETAIAGAVLAVVVAFLVKTGLDMASAYQQIGVGACLGHDPSPTACQSVVNAFQAQFSDVTGIITWLNFLPLLLGVLLAAPFVLDLEHGTYQLAWTQSVTRGRWLTVRLGLILAVAVLASLGLTILMTWWNSPLDHLGSRLTANQFDFEGVVPVAYTVFAAALCLAAGSLLRRSAPAMGLTLAVYLVMRVVLVRLRLHYLPPVTKHVPMSSGGLAGPMTSSRADYFMRADASIPKGIMRLCFGGSLQPPPAGSAAAHHLEACFGQHGVFASVVYQPASRFWLFQGIESAIFLVPALALLALTAWWVSSRVS
jgi:hypothetical protein